MQFDLISIERWSQFLEQFARQHRGWLISIETVRTDERTQVLAVDARMENVTLESDDRIEVAVTDKAGGDGPIMHVIAEPAHTFLKMTDDHKHAGLRVETANNELHHLIFRAAAAPETLNGLT
jgi:hypothetical protein